MAFLWENFHKIEGVLTEFPTCPLTYYRKLASFDWKKLKLAVEGEDVILYKFDVWRFLKNHAIFHQPTVTLSFQDWRHLTFQRYKILKENKILPYPKAFSNPRINAAWLESLVIYNADVAAKLTLSCIFFMNTIRNLGTKKHSKYIEMAEKDEIHGCFALTEVSHGSNAKGMKTTATFDSKANQFILHSVDFTSAKCWVGGLGQCATHAIVFAKLIMPDGQAQGLHPFIVPVRCKRTLKSFSGVLIGDLGEKLALNGVDNGFVMFHNYRIGKDCLLNRFGDIDSKGCYTSPIKDPNKRFGAILGTLSGGRIQITGIATIYTQKAIIIATRYSAVRKQFGPENCDEYAVLEYQHQQFRLIPYIAITYAFRIFYAWLSESHTASIAENISALKSKVDNEKITEFHALSSASKPLASWVAQRGIQACRELCGGHGYLLAAGIGKLYAENDGNCTYEGENSLLVQQTSNWLLKLFKYIKAGNKINTPLDTINYLNNYQDILKTKGSINSPEDAVNPKVLLNAYKWLVCYMLKLTSEKENMLIKGGNDRFTIKNNIQSYHAVPLSIVYVEHVILNQFYKFVLQLKDEKCRKVMLNLVSLYGAWNLENNLSTLYMGGYLNGDDGQYVREGVIGLCRLLKSEAVALVDAMSPPDFILNSPLGNSNGNVYENLQSIFYSYPGSLSRPNWWSEVLKWDMTTNSKL